MIRLLARRLQGWRAARAEARRRETEWIRLRLMMLAHEDKPGAAEVLADFERSHPRPRTVSR